MLWSKAREKILRCVKKDPRITLNQIKKSYGLNISLNTIRNFFLKHGYQSRLTIKKPEVSEKNRKARLNWCNKYKNKPIKFWENIVFTDESPFYVNFQQRERVWLHENDPPILTETKKFTTKINIWGGFCTKGVTNLVKVEGIMNRF